MAVALNLAQSTVGQTSPNPSVGAVVVKNGRIVGMGSHLQAGEPHAEVHALNQAGEQAAQADIYVTLEPCVHTGKTPPCTDLLIKKKIKRVFIASIDPNPKVAGKGIKRLKEAGIEVEVGLGEAEALKLNEPFFYYMKHQRPFVTLKAAMTLDGKIATKTGNSQWITSDQAREDVHYQRAIHDAILVGRQTIASDNPQLTVRKPQYGKNPIRIILATDLAIAPDRQILNDLAPTWVVCGSQADATSFQSHYSHIKVVQLATPYIDIDELLGRLGELGIQSLYVEGGSTVHASFIKARAFQVCHWYIAPKLLTGKQAIGVVAGNSPLLMAEALDLKFEAIEQLGVDLKVIARPKKEAK